MVQVEGADGYPIVLIEDRYQGVYSGGRWLALTNADEAAGSYDRISWVMEEGPGAGDVEAGIFWASPPDWIAAGSDPNDALAQLMGKMR